MVPEDIAMSDDLSFDVPAILLLLAHKKDPSTKVNFPVRFLATGVASLFPLLSRGLHLSDHGFQARVFGLNLFDFKIYTFFWRKEFS